MASRILSLVLAVLVGALAIERLPARRTARSWWPRPRRRRISGLFGYLFADLQGQDRHRGEGDRARHRTKRSTTARRGDADVVFVHARAQEEKFLAEGFGVKRFDVMYNDFVLIGGPEVRSRWHQGQRYRDRAEDHSGQGCAVSSRAATGPAPIRPELALWKQAGIDISVSKGPWVPRDRGRHGRGAEHRGRDERLQRCPTAAPGFPFKNRGDLDIVVEGDKRLFNQYGVMLVNPEKYPSVKKELGQAFVDG